MQVRNQQLESNMEQQTGFKLGKEYIKAVYCHPAYLTYMQSIYMPSMWNAGPDEAQAGIKISGKDINNLKYQYYLLYADVNTLMAEGEEELKSFLMKVKEDSEKVGLQQTFKNWRSWHSVPSLHGKSTGKQ